METTELHWSTDTVGALVESGTAALATAGISTARLDAEVLLAHACGTDRAALYARWRSIVPPDRRSRFDTLVARRQKREPLQYIVGRQEFWSLDFVVTPDVLIPRPETELLVELAFAILPEAAFGSPLPTNEPTVPIRHARNPQVGIQWVGDGFPPKDCGNDEKRYRRMQFVGPTHQRSAGQRSLGEGQGEGLLRLCDLGTGSGCIAVALARELPHAQVWALDISEAALDVAQLNAWRHAVAEHVHFLASDGFSAAKGLRFDAIVCNPPYVSSGELQRAQPELAWEPRHALDGGPVGLTVIERFVAEAPRYLTEGGWLLMEIGADQGLAVERLAQAAGFGSVSIRADYAGLPRALVARR